MTIPGAKASPFRRLAALTALVPLAVCAVTVPHWLSRRSQPSSAAHATVAQHPAVPLDTKAPAFETVRRAAIPSFTLPSSGGRHADSTPSRPISWPRVVATGISSGEGSRVPAACRVVTQSTRVSAGQILHVPGRLALKRGPSGERTILRVSGGRCEVASLQTEDDSILYVEDGELVITGDGTGNPVTISGTFVVADSWGSLYLLGDTVFDGDDLLLVSHVVIGDGVTVQVSGSMTLDGCVIEPMTPEGHYRFQVLAGATFRMSRSEVSGCGTADPSPTSQGFFIDCPNASVESCVFAGNNAGLVLGANAVDSRVFHNVFENNPGGHAVDLGTGTAWALDGWGNVWKDGAPHPADPAPLTAEPANRLTLLLEGADVNGEIFIQPGDPVTADMSVANLREPVSGCEAMLGFSSSHFSMSATLELGPDWDFRIAEQWAEKPGFLAQLDTAIGLGLSAPLSGINTDNLVASVNLTATTEEGITKVYFRPWFPEDGPIDTRLTSDPDGQSGHYLTPFTANTGTITIDGTPPDVADLVAGQEQAGSIVSLIDPSPHAAAKQGTVSLSFATHDALAGVVEAGAAIQIVLKNDPGVELSPVFTGTTEETIDDLPYTRHHWTLTVDSSTPDGEYEVLAWATDRSGNVSATESGTLHIDGSQAEVAVALEGWMSPSTKTLEFEFIASDASGAQIGQWLVSVEIQGLDGTESGMGRTLVSGIPSDIAALSAKCAGHLRRRQPADYATATLGGVSFYGENIVFAGDLNGDNIVNLLDYLILRDGWLSAGHSSDMNGDDVTNLLDFLLMRDHWYTAGDNP